MGYTRAALSDSRMNRPSSSVPKNVRISRAPVPTEGLSAEPAEERPVTKKRNDSTWSTTRRWLKRIGLTLVALAAIGAIALYFVIRHFEADLPSTAQLRGNYRPPQTTRMLARDGSVMAELFTERRTLVSIRELPPHVKLAVLAAEDAGFYEHEGLNYWGILRAMLINARQRRVVQGGSTITQQVVKNVILDSERSYRRKIREALLARRLEQDLTKDEILEIYLNEIYFGHGRYGIEEASRDLFGKSAKALSVGEAALIAGVVAGPEKFYPRHNLAGAMDRRAYVLNQMTQKGFLNEKDFDTAKEEAPRIVAPVETNNELAPEAIQIVRKMLREVAPERAALGGFTIQTSIDPKIQSAARAALRNALSAYDKRHGLIGKLKAPPSSKPKAAEKPIFSGVPSFESHKVYTGVVLGADDAQGTFDVKVGSAVGVVKLADYERYNPQHLAPSAFATEGARVRVSLLAPLLPPAADGSHVKVPLRLELGPEGAMVVLDVRTREILALVGNYEAASGGLDRATQSRRQPGSTFKPIVYSCGLHTHQFTPATLIDPTPVAFGNYRPANYEGWKGVEPIRLREALANSVNVVAVHVLDEVGPATVVDWAKGLGIRSTLKPDLSLALGSYEVEPIELAGAYATFAGGGTFEMPRLVRAIRGPDEKELELPILPPSMRVLDEAESYLITNMMTSVIDHGTAQRAKSLGRPVAGKTGTSNEAKDTWFAGFSTDVVAVVWIGFDDSKPLGSGETGATTALPAWIEVMKAIHEKRPVTDFPKPTGLVSAQIDAHTGKLAYPDDPDTMDELFLTGTEPTEISPVMAPDAGTFDPADSAADEPADASENEL